MSQLYTHALEADQIRFSISIFIGNLGGTRCVGSALYDNCQVESISQGGRRGGRLVFGFYDEMSHKLNYRHDRMKRLRIPLVKGWLWNKSTDNDWVK
jgi:hypothetical protein